MKYSAIAVLVAGLLAYNLADDSQGSSTERLHYAPNGNFNRHGQFLQLRPALTERTSAAQCSSAP